MQSTQRFIVGIGLSEDGLPSLHNFFSHVPDHSGLIYILAAVQASEHQADLTEKLASAVHLPVVKVSDKLPLLPDHLYIVPPDTFLTRIDSRFHLSKKDSKQATTIDHLFQLLAQSHGDKTASILMGNTGKEGEVGGKAIKARGGLTVAQKQQEDDFPDSEQHSWADIMLSPAQMPAFLLHHASGQTNPSGESEKQAWESRFSAEQQAMLAATDIATLFLDTKLQLLHCTPKFQEQFNFTPTGPEIPASRLIHVLNYGELISDARQLLEHAQPIERKIQAPHAKHYLSRMLPYRDAEDVLRGIALTFTDIYPREETTINQWGTHEEKYRRLFSALRDGFCVCEALIDENHQPYDYRFLEVNHTFEEHTGLRGATGKTALELVPDLEPHWVELYGKVAIDQKAVRFEQGSQAMGRWFDVYAFPFGTAQSRIFAIQFKDISGRKKAELALEAALAEQGKQKKFLENLIHHSPIAIAVVQGEELIFTLVNPTYQAIVGHEIPLPGKKYQDIFPEAIPSGVVQGLQHVIASGQAWKIRNFKILRGQTLSWWEGEVLPLPNEEGKVDSALIQTWDITERKMAEETLQESESRFRSFANTAPAMLWVTDAQGKTTFLSRAWYEYSGQTEDSGLGFGWIDAIHPEEKEHARETFMAALTQRQPFRFDYRFRTAEGSYRWAIDAGLPHYGESGEFQGYVGSVIDIHDRKEVEEALRKSEQLARSRLDEVNAIYATAPIGLCVLDTELRFVRINRHLAEINGYPVEHHLGKHVRDILPKVADTVIPLLQQIIDTGQPVLNFEVVGETAAQPGVAHTWVESWFPFRDNQGKVIGINIVAEEVTERKRAEEAIHQAKEEAEKAAMAKEEFLSTMSHEIRTPLNAIIGLTNLLLKANPRPDQLRNLNTLLYSSRSLRALVNDILDYSKIEAGKIEMEAVDFELPPLLDSIQQAHSPLAEEKENELRLHIAQQVPHTLRGDPHKLSQVLHNLISNANKFTQEGLIQTEVSLLKQEGDEVELHFAVRDTGIGIPEEQMQKIFEKFTQADSSTVRRFGGTGLGLSITKSLLQLMDSHISVESKEGEGSVFSFSLRLSIGDPKHLRSAETEKVVPTDGSTQEIRQAKILLVEDAPINRMVVQQYLEAWWQLQADEAINGQEAVEMARQKKYDLILMDIRMPIMDGIEASRLIRKIDAHFARVPIVALTADISVVENKESTFKLFNVHITKPVEPEQLMNTISALLLETTIPPSNVEREKSEVQPEDTLQPDFVQAEEPFEGLPEKKKKFYDMAIHSLQNYQSDFFRAVEQKALERLKDLMHKEKLLMNMMGLEVFYQKMHMIRIQLEGGVAHETLRPELTEIRQGLEEIIARVKSHRQSLL